MTAALRFLDGEGLARLVDARKRWGSEEWGILCHGFPWGRFLIPGRSGQKNVDYHEWSGLIPLVLDRLHLSKSPRWAAAVDASRTVVPCSACDGTGFDWIARHYQLGPHSVAQWFTERTHRELLDFLAGHADAEGCRALLGPLEQVVLAGLGNVGLGTPCGDLAEGDRRRVRVLGACQLGFAEATYCVRGPEAGRNSGQDGVTALLEAAAADRRIVVVTAGSEGS
jgi:hypothetical protein